MSAWDTVTDEISSLWNGPKLGPTEEPPIPSDQPIPTFMPTMSAPAEREPGPTDTAYNPDLDWEDKQQLAKGGLLSSDEQRMYGVKNWKKPVSYLTKTCPVCGGENSASADKCQYCGTDIKGVAPG